MSNPSLSLSLPPSQLPVGRQSIEHYRSLTRTPVFSHDELLCKMVAQPEKLELCLLSSSSDDMAKMTGLEEKIREDLKLRVRPFYCVPYTVVVCVHVCVCACACHNVCISLVH